MSEKLYLVSDIVKFSGLNGSTITNRAKRMGIDRKDVNGHIAFTGEDFEKIMEYKDARK
jgi:hypothetical protein